MNIPNILTMSRIVLALVLVFLLKQGSEAGNIMAVVVFIIASLTDYFDGHLAKSQGLVSDFGKIMDPIADKVLLLLTLGVLAHLGMIDWRMFAVIAAREILVTASRLCAMLCHGRVLGAEGAGKIKTVIQMMAVLVILLYLVARGSDFCAGWFSHVQKNWESLINMLMWAAVILTVYSGGEYFRNKWKMGHETRGAH
ncbi:MAG: CDP-diacylglycerol--glycerol-3-phosphate 3-phosphatidyltransferase [Candidatus Omnitrophica bacterium]|nr:CDP-diacylglycerol--glycerol-3-phosphate 3-phosphatidyltransferase [Candidatus Omnitrophota bacterium]